MPEGYPQHAVYLLSTQSTKLLEIETAVEGVSDALPGVVQAVEVMNAELVTADKTKVRIGGAVKSSGTAGAYTTAHSYNGAGVLRFVGQKCYTKTASESTNHGSVKLTVDGTVLYDGIAAVSGSGAAIGNGDGGPLLTMPLKFQTSLLIEHKFDLNTGILLHTVWNYDVD